MPCDSDVEEYKSLLARENPLVLPEATFLSQTDDLVRLGTIPKTKDGLSGPSNYNLLQVASLRAHIAIVTAVFLHLLAWDYFTSTIPRVVIGTSIVIGVYTILSKRG